MAFSPDELEEFERLMKSAVPGRVVSNFIFIAEMMSGDGPDLEVFLSPSITPWLASGMLNYAEELLSVGLYSDEDDEE